MTPSDVKIVIENINDFIEVPDGINRLRKAVLTLAMSGQLVEQDEKEGTAEDLYLKIQNDRKKEDTGVTGRKRKVHEFAPLTPEEIPFELPSSWKWVRLGEIVEFRVGKTPPRKEPQYWSNAEVPWVSIADLNAGGAVSSTKEKINSLALDKVFGGYIAPKGTLLFSFKLTIGKMSLLEVDACHNEAIAAFFPINDILRDYLFSILSVINTTGRTSNAIKGKTLNSETLALIEVPLPPLAEQKRIVERVQSVMKQLDELESRKNERDVVRSRLTRSVMQALGFADTKIAFDHLTELIKTQQDIKELENAILTLAVSGKLVSQDESEGTAEQLYTQIKAHREAQENAGVRKKKSKDLAPVTSEEIPFIIPESWKWVRILDLAELITDGEHISPTKRDSGVPLATAKNVLENGVILDKVDYVSEEDAKKFWKRCNPQMGDLLICSRGTIGRATVVNIDTPFCLMGSVILIKFSESTLSEYLKYYLRTEAGIAQIGLLRKGMAVGALYLKDIEKALVPLPPLAEQKRIVKKVEELMLMVNKLKKIIT